MIKMLAHGVVSGRKLAEVCRSDVRYLVLSGEQRPDFRTFHRFVERHLNDLEAMPMAKRGGEFKYGYNVQAAVDEKSQVIVAAKLHDSPQDSKALPATLDKIEENCGKNAAEVLADSGYQSGPNLNAIESKGSTPYVAKARGEKVSSVTVAEQVIPIGPPHAYECKAGKQLPVNGKMSDGRTLVSIPTGFCDGCSFQGGCRLYGKRKNKTITIMSEDHRRAYIMNIERLRSSEGQAVYRRRKAIVEPVFGNIKVNKAMRILVKGRQKVSVWWKMAATAHNLEKIIGTLAAAT